MRFAAHAADYQLKATPATVAWGYYWSAAKPVLRIKSGDSVEMQTMLTNSPERLAAAGVKDEDIEPELKAITAEVKDKGPGGHILTGPIFIEGAEPGDTLEVRILSIKYSIPYAYNSFRPTSGVLTAEDFPKGATKIIPLDIKRGVAKFSDRHRNSLAALLRQHGSRAARSRRTRIERAARNARRQPGQQGPGRGYDALHPGTRTRARCSKSATATPGRETARWTSRRSRLRWSGTFEFVVRKDLHLKAPRGETPTHFISMGLNPDLTEALKMAVREAIDFLVTEKHLSREDAYMLCSVGRGFQRDAGGGRDQRRPRHDPEEHFQVGKSSCIRGRGFCHFGALYLVTDK